MKQLIALCMVAAFSQPVLAAVDNETVYLQCKGMLDRKASGTKAVTTDQNIDAVACVTYVAGHRDSFNWSRSDPDNKCDFGERSLLKTVEDYVAFTRRNGLLTEPAGLVFNQLFENCYCHDNPQMERISCFDRK